MGVDIPERSVNAYLLCPLHDENTPSFSVHLDSGLWQCFGCGQTGNIDKLARLLGEELDDETRQDILIRSLSITPEDSRRNFAPVANGYIQALETSDAGQALLRDYLDRRGLPRSVADDFGLGYDESRRCLAFPYWDSGTVTGIKLRAPDASKYSYTDSTYGLYNVDDLRGKPVVVIGEGESDTHTLWSHVDRVDIGDSSGRLDGPHARDGGTPNSHIGIGGTSGAVKSERLWSLWALDLLFARKIYVCYDADDAGDSAFNVAARTLGDKVIRVRPTRGVDITEHVMNGGTLEELGLAAKDLHV